MYNNDAHKHGVYFVSYPFLYLSRLWTVQVLMRTTWLQASEQSWMS